ncbi:MAG TPA: alpha amylase C-terminal domain-containing protein, partial [Burkholderiaceae bacterium]
GESLVLVISHFTPAVHQGMRIGVPRPGRYVERLNTDSEHYGGSNVGTPLARAGSEPVGAHGRAQSIVIDLPPLATVFFEWTAA